MTACETKKTYPKEFVGYWQRQTGPDSWADDTLELKADGHVGSKRYAAQMESAYWYVSEHTVGSPTLCMGDKTGFTCLGYRVTAEAFNQFGGPTPPVQFRRVHM